MIRNKVHIIMLIMIMALIVFTGCNGDKPDGEMNDIDSEINKEGLIEDFELRDGEIANYLSYRYEDKSMYFAGLKTFDEFGASNEGGLIIIPEDNTLIFSITKATGTVTGAVDGPHVYFVMDLTNNTIKENRFDPAPNYAELGITEFIEHSEEVIELSDERMIEIGLYFKEMIEQIESKM